jgi:hypothetical protein
MLRNQKFSRLWVLLTVNVLAIGLLLQPQQSQALTSAALQRGMLATVKLLVIDSDLNVIGTCSGTHLGGGVIVTNFHCVGHTDLYGADDTGMGLQNGDFYNSDGLIGVAPTKDPKKVPDPTYMAKVIASNPDVDVAVVKINGMIDDSSSLPSAIPIVAMTLADSDKVNPGDPIHVVGYPGAGGDLITYTEGKVAGYYNQTGGADPDSFKVTAAINPGNSGGLAMNDDGNQVGIPTFHPTDGEGIGGVRMINIAVPYINQVINLGGTTVTNTNTTPIDPGTTPVPGNTTGPFGPITFGTDIQNNKLVGPATTFPATTARILGVFPFQGMRNGMKWGPVWQIGGKIVVDDRAGETWNAGAQGVNYAEIHAKQGNLPSGQYTLQLYVNGSPVQQGQFVVGTGTPGPKQTPIPPTDNGVVLQGRIVDADTGDGVSGAAIIILKPGVTASQWANAADSDSLTQAAGVADSDGNYLTSPGIPRSQTYTVLVGAQGYQARVFEDGLEIADKDPDVIPMDDLQIQKK